LGRLHAGIYRPARGSRTPPQLRTTEQHRVRATRLWYHRSFH